MRSDGLHHDRSTEGSYPIDSYLLLMVSEGVAQRLPHVLDHHPVLGHRPRDEEAPVVDGGAAHLHGG